MSCHTRIFLHCVSVLPTRKVWEGETEVRGRRGRGERCVYKEVLRGHLDGLPIDFFWHSNHHSTQSNFELAISTNHS